MSTVIFYTTSGCHLCEQAEQLLLMMSEKKALTWESVDIADDPALVERYGIRIPVVQRRADGTELGWPFDQEMLDQFLHQ